MRIRTTCIAAASMLAAGCASTPAVHSKVPEYKKADLDGSKIYYQNFGAGPEAVVFVHGWACDHTVFRYQVQAFAPKARTIALDLIGHGKSDAPKVEYTFDLFARSIDAVLRDAGVDRAVLVGHSNGMPAIRQYYRLYPSKVLALVNIDGTLKAFYNKPEDAKKELEIFEGPKYLAAMDQYTRAVLTNRLPPETRQAVSDMMKRTPQHVIVGDITATLDMSIWKDDPIDVPLLCVLAKQPFWDDAYEAYVRKLSPSVDYRVFDGVGHFLMMEKPDLVNTAILDFLTRNHLLL
jgi:pimeloyl-ACP methyl ester carboxylesterase